MAKVSELSSYIDRLLRVGENGSSYLIITVSGTEDFIQLMATSEGVELDFPLISGRQMSFESKFRSIAQMEDCTVIENRGDDGARFLDVELPFSTSEVTRICQVFLSELFGVGLRTPLEFEGDCLETNH